jgi:hypothetical protein
MNETKKTLFNVAQIMTIGVALLYFLGIMEISAINSVYGLTEIIPNYDFNVFVVTGFLSIFFTLMTNTFLFISFIIFVTVYFRILRRRFLGPQNNFIDVLFFVFVFGLITGHSGIKLITTNMQKYDDFYAGKSVKIHTPYMRVSYTPHGSTSPATTEGFEVDRKGSYLVLYREQGLFAISHATISTMQVLIAPKRHQAISKKSSSHEEKAIAPNKANSADAKSRAAD